MWEVREVREVWGAWAAFEVQLSDLLGALRLARRRAFGLQLKLA